MPSRFKAICPHDIPSNKLKTFIRLRFMVEICAALESFSRYEVLELAAQEYPSLIGPACQVLLPLGNALVGIVQIPVRLAVGQKNASLSVSNGSHGKMILQNH